MTEGNPVDAHGERRASLYTPPGPPFDTCDAAWLFSHRAYASMPSGNNSAGVSAQDVTCRADC